jgi:hypothetical protein
MNLPVPPILASMLLATLLGLLTPPQASGDTRRSHGAQDTSRHAPARNSLGAIDARTDHSGRDYAPRTGYPTDPATRRFWSPKCVQQRQSGASPLNHTRDCDNPAYTGAYRPYPPPYPHPYRPGNDRFGTHERPYGPWGGKGYRPLRPPSSIRPWSGYGRR